MKRVTERVPWGRNTHVGVESWTMLAERRIKPLGILLLYSFLSNVGGGSFFTDTIREESGTKGNGGGLACLDRT